MLSDNFEAVCFARIVYPCGLEHFSKIQQILREKFCIIFSKKLWSNFLIEKKKFTNAFWTKKFPHFVKFGRKFSFYKKIKEKFSTKLDKMRVALWKIGTSTFGKSHLVRDLKILLELIFFYKIIKINHKFPSKPDPAKCSPAKRARFWKIF